MPQFPPEDSQNRLAVDCQRCPELVSSRNCLSWGNGPLDASVVVVGEAPGAGNPHAERWKGGNWTGMAYTSRHSGRRIRELFEEIGFGPEECYFTNAVKCFPSDGEGSNREPTATERANCRPYLRREIETVDPAVVVPTGKHATNAVFALAGKELDGFLDSVLSPIEWPSLGTTLLPLIHPSYQNIWVERIGYTSESYRAAVKQTLESLCEKN